MAHPKRRQSKTRTAKRRTHDKAVAPTLAICPNCGEWHVYHTVCGACGYWRFHNYSDNAILSFVRYPLSPYECSRNGNENSGKEKGTEHSHSVPQF